jgi:hypothetical protein
MIMQPHKKLFLMAPLWAVQTKDSIIGGLAANRWPVRDQSDYE